MLVDVPPLVPVALGEDAAADDEIVVEDVVEVVLGEDGGGAAAEVGVPHVCPEL